MSKKKKDFPKEKSDLRGAEGSASLRQGCVLTAHGDPQHITSALRRQENLRDYNIMLGILDFTGSGHWAPFNLSQNTAMIMDFAADQEHNCHMGTFEIKKKERSI